MTDDREDVLLRRQKLLADFGDFALLSEDLDGILSEACRLVGDAMATGRAKVLQIEDDGKTLLVRAGVGWARDIVGRTRIPMGKQSSESFSINERKPVISTDVSQDDRFDVPGFMKEAGVRALANVPIFLPGGRAFGLLQVDASEPRDFDQDDVEFLRTYATILGPIIDRILKLSALRSSEERFRLTVQEASDYAIFITDETDRITDWLRGAAQIFGWSAQEAIGQPGSILFTPEDRAAGIDVQEIAEAHEKGFAPNVRWHLRKDGSRVFIDGSVRALRNAKGRVTGYLKIGQDVTQRREADNRLRESEERLEIIFASAPVGLSELDLNGRFLRANSELCRILGRSQDEVLAATVQEVTHPEDVQPSLDAVAEAIATDQPVSLDKRYRKPDGAEVWANSTLTVLRDRDGCPGSLLAVTADLTARREAEERQKVLIAELHHRTRNLMTVVLALSDMTARASTDLAHFRARFQGRLEALARVQGLLSRLSAIDRVTFDELLQTELSAMGGDPDRVTLSGPRGIQLRSSTVQTLAMALHELATNAVKYGAFRQATGRLAITWSLDTHGPGREPWLHVDWRESGVEMPPEGMASRRVGQGRELIERALPYQLKANTTFAFTPDGVHCTIGMPVSARTGEQSKRV